MGTAAVEADTYIDSFNDTQNFGSEATAVIGSAATQLLRCILRFDHADIPGSVSQVSLVLPVASFLLGRVVYDIHVLDYDNMADEWSEADTTWLNYTLGDTWATAGGSYLATPKVSWDSTGAPTGDNTIIVSTLLSASRLADHSKFSLLIKKQTETGTNTVTINTDEGTGGASLTWSDSSADSDGLRYRRNFQRDLHNRLWPRKHF